MDVIIKFEGLYAYPLMPNFRLHFPHFFFRSELPVVFKKYGSVDFTSARDLKDADFLFIALSHVVASR